MDFVLTTLLAFMAWQVVRAQYQRSRIALLARHLSGLQLERYMETLAEGYARDGMTAYVELQQAEFAMEERGYTATRHQREVGAGYFDAVSMAITGGQSSTTAMKESTEHDQFRPAAE